MTANPNDVGALLHLTVFITQTHFVITQDIPHKDKVGLEFFEVNFCFAMPRSVVSQQPVDKLAVEFGVLRLDAAL